MNVMACAPLLWCLGLVESIPMKRGYQHVARETGQHQPVSPDFVMQLRVSDNTTATLFAYKRAPIHPLTAEEQMTLTRGGGGGGDWKEENGSLVDSEVELSFQSQQLKHHSSQSNIGSSDVYDEKGAMYFAVAVILFYGISIAMLVAASTLKRSHTDYELKGFLRSYARIDEERRSREKQKVRMVLQQKNLMHMLPGFNLAAGSTTALLAGTVDRQPQQLLQQQNPLQQPPLQQQITVREQHPLQQQNAAHEEHSLQQKPTRNSLKRSERQQSHKRQREEEQQHQETYQQKQKFQQQNLQKQQRQQVKREQLQHVQRRSMKVLFREKDGSTRTETEVDPSPEVDGYARRKTMRRRSTDDLLRASPVVIETAAAPAPSPFCKFPTGRLT